MNQQNIITPAILRHPPGAMPAEIPPGDIVEIDKFKVRKKPRSNSASPTRELDGPDFSPAPQRMVVSYQFISPEDLAENRHEKHFYWLIQDRNQPPLRIQVESKFPQGADYRYECFVPPAQG